MGGALTAGSQFGTLLMLSAGLLVASPLAPDPFFAGLPLALAMLGGLVGFPAAALLQRWGTKRTLLFGLMLGAGGAALVVAGLTTGHFSLVCGGFLVYGTHRVFLPNQRLTGWSLAGFLVAAVLAPLAVLWGRDAGTVPFLGSFLVLLGVVALQAVAASVTPLRALEPVAPPPPATGEQGPRWRTALAVLALGAAAQALLVAAAPVAMHEYGHPLWAAMLVLAVYGLALGLARALAPRLQPRWGRGLAGAALAVLALPAVFNPMGTDLVFFLVPLALLGAGWGLLSAGVTAGLAGRAPAAAAGLFAALACFAAGAWERPLGWGGLQLVSLAFLAAAALVLLTQSRRS